MRQPLVNNMVPPATANPAPFGTLNANGNEIDNDPAAMMQHEDEHELLFERCTKKKRGRTSTFPQSLHQMLSDLEKGGRTHIASFVYDGRAFQIHNPDLFVKECIPKYFKMSSLSSFQRQVCHIV